MTTASNVPNLSPASPKSEYPSFVLPKTLATLVFSLTALAEMFKSSLRWKAVREAGNQTVNW